MSNPLEQLLRGLIPGNVIGSGDDDETTHIVNISGPGSEEFFTTMGLPMHPTIITGQGRGRGGARGAAAAAAAAQMREGRGRGGRGTPGTVYTGGIPPPLWIQREQQRTPLHFSATVGAASFDGNLLRQEGNGAFQAGNYMRAVELYTRAIELSPDTEVNYTNRSFAYFKLGRFEESAQDAREAVRLSPNFFKGHYRLGMALLHRREYLPAISALRRALDLAPEANKGDVRCAIAKCESKMARAPGTPLLMDSPTPGGQRSQFPAPGQTGAKVDYDRLRELLETAASLRRDVATYAAGFGGQEEIVQCKERSQTVKRLMGIATSSRLPELAKEAEERQEALRRSLKGPNRRAYAEAKRARDKAYQDVWDTAEEVEDAIAKLRGIAAEERKFFLRFGEPTTPQKGVAEEGAVAATGSSGSGEKSPTRVLEEALADVGPATDTGSGAVDAAAKPDASETAPDDDQSCLGRLLTRRQSIHDAVAKARGVFDATNAAAAQLERALAEEATVAAEIGPLLREAVGLNEELERHARHVAKTTTAELSDSRLDALGHMGTTAERCLADKDSFQKSLAEGDSLLEEEARLERERLLLEKQRIQLQAEVEWFKVNDEPEGRIKSLQQHIANVQQRLSDTNTGQNAVQKRILELVETAHPELAWKSMASGPRILRLVKGIGLWLNLNYSDFQIVATLSSTVNSKVYHATRRGEHVALKEVSVNDEAAKRRFQREISLVASCSHPNIVKIKGVFFDGPFAYVLLPFYRKGSVKSVLQEKKPLSWLSVQNILRQIASGMAYLHERGIVHGDIKPSNILISDDDRPIIADFGIAKDNARFGDGVDITTTTTVTGTIAGTASYMAPEQLLGESRRSTTKSDVWALGLTFYEIAANNAFFNDPEVGEPSSPGPKGAAAAAANGRVDIPARRVGGDEKLADLISSMVVVDSDARATAYEVLGHPYFSASLAASADTVSSEALVKSDRRIEAVRSYIHAVRAARPQKTLVSVSRNQMVESLASIIPEIGEEGLLEPIMVVFQGEAGIDEGALTSEMLNLFYAQMVRDTKALVCARDEEEIAPAAGGAGGGAGGGDSGDPRSGLVLGASYLPAEDAKNVPVDLFVLLGKVMLKSIVENRPLPLQLSSAVLKFFCNVPVSILDLEEYDRPLTESLKRFRLMSAEDLSAADIDFSEFSATFLEKAMGGKYNRDTAVTADNVRDFVDLSVRYELIEKRQRALDGMKKGFYSVSSIEPHLKLLSPSDLLLLLCGVQHVPPQTVADALEFQGFDSRSKTPQYLKEILLEMSQNNLRRFLELCTSSAALPATDAMRKIKVLMTRDTSRLPVGHGCVFQLDLPDYNDKEKLKEKLELALAHVSDGFHIV